jgi:aerobic-type carbon monoxide dehydrogenase small subunit (CoxS/CutS family)
MAKFELTVNGGSHRIDTEPERPLLDVLREDFDLSGSKYGCGEGQCRACTVLMDGKPVTSCLIPMRVAAGKKVITIEGLANGERLHPVQQAFLDEGAMQCGYCTPGMILRTISLLEATPSPTDAQINEGLNGNLCRCGGYNQIVNAVKKAASQGAKRSA